VWISGDRRANEVSRKRLEQEVGTVKNVAHIGNNVTLYTTKAPKHKTEDFNNVLEDIRKVLTDIVKNQLFLPVPDGVCVYDCLAEQGNFIRVAMPAYDENDISTFPELFERPAAPFRIEGYYLKFTPTHKGFIPVWCRAIPCYRVANPFSYHPEPYDEYYNEYVILDTPEEFKNLLDTLYGGDVTYAASVFALDY
jgi:hypothetical protein